MANSRVWADSRVDPPMSSRGVDAASHRPWSSTTPKASGDDSSGEEEDSGAAKLEARTEWKAPGGDDGVKQVAFKKRKLKRCVDHQRADAFCAFSLHLSSFRLTRSVHGLTMRLRSGSARRANARKKGSADGGPERDLSVQPTILKQSRE